MYCIHFSVRRTANGKRLKHDFKSILCKRVVIAIGTAYEINVKIGRQRVRWLENQIFNRKNSKV